MRKNEGYHRMVLFVGRTCSGKDTLVKALQRDGLIDPVISYATRPIRKNEDVSNHHFIHKDDVEKIIKEKGCLVRTKIGNYEYFTTKDEFYKKDGYIINPKAIKDLIYSMDRPTRFLIVYVEANYTVKEKRSRKRNDDENEFRRRYVAENDEFNKFLKKPIYKNRILYGRSTLAFFKFTNNNKIQFMINYLRLKRVIKKFKKGEVNQ